MKFLEILLSFITSQGKSLLQANTEAVTRQVINNARRIVALLAVAGISIALVCTGFTMAYKAAIESVEASGGVTGSAGLIGGLILTALAATGLVCSLSEKRWLKAVNVSPESQTQAPPPPSGPTLQDAIALLIVEVSHELKDRRTSPETAPTQKNS